MAVPSVEPSFHTPLHRVNIKLESLGAELHKSK